MNISAVGFFLSLGSIPLYDYSTIYSCIQQLMDIWVLSQFEAIIHKSGYEHSRISFCADFVFISLGQILRNGITGSYGQ